MLYKSTLREPRGVHLAELLLLKERATDDWEDTDMIHKCSLIMYENRYYEERPRGMKTKVKLERDLWGDEKGMLWGDRDTHNIWWKGRAHMHSNKESKNLNKINVGSQKGTFLGAKQTTRIDYDCFTLLVCIFVL
jgi:hypothetical protein